MGICPSLSPEERAIQKQNEHLKDSLLGNLKELYIYNFSGKLKAIVPDIKPRYLLNQGIIEDINKLNVIAFHNQSIKTDAMDTQNLEEDLKNSCLIIEDYLMNPKQTENLKPEDVYGSFRKNLVQHQSLVVQMNILYQPQLSYEKYNKSLKFFLKWSTVFQEHCYGGFLKPIYRQFCQALYQLPVEQSDTIVDEVSIFVQYMVSVYTEAYHLKDLVNSQNGQLFKNQNVYNLIMSFMFKRTKINRFVKTMIEKKEEEKIKNFEKKLNQYKNKNIEFFQVSPEFVLKKQSKIDSSHLEQSSFQNLSIPSLKQQHKLPYSSCLKLVDELCEPTQTPITKLKIIVTISKKIMKQIYDYYDKCDKVPDLDPDNLSSIIMFLICKVGRSQIYAELKIVEYFTTTNCLNCISGFYLNTFSAVIESILTMEQ